MKKGVLVVISIAGFISTRFQSSPVFIEDGKAIRGYDPVAYFNANKPVQGKTEFVYTWDNAKWYFSSQQNLDSFRTNPMKYAPQYGGYCAYGCSQGQGHKASTSADAWTIVNDKLYLNYDTKIRSTWNKDRQDRIIQADKNWPNIKDKE